MNRHLTPFIWQKHLSFTNSKKPKYIKCPLRAINIFWLFLLMFSITAVQAQAIDSFVDFTAIDSKDFLEYGASVAVGDKLAIVGAPGDFGNKGAAYFISLDDGVWEQQQKIGADDGTDNDLFGTSVATFGDWVLVGAPGKSGEEGAAYLFKKSGNLLAFNTLLVADNPTAFDHFGISVGLSEDYAIVGASGYQGSKGAVYVFKKNDDDTWSQVNILSASDGATSDEFGHSVSIVKEHILVGARYKDFFQLPTPVVPQAGAAYVFELVNDIWAQTASLVASDMAAYDYFGHSVSITHNNGTGVALVGAYGKDAANMENSGGAYFYSGTGATWTETALTAPTPNIADQFAWSVAISDSVAAIGSPFLNDGVGGVYLFRYTAGIIGTSLQVDAMGTVADNLGYSTGIYKGTAMAGAYRNATLNFNGGKAFLYELVAQAEDFEASDATHESGVNLTWDNRSTNADEYVIYRDGALLATLAGTMETYFDGDPALVINAPHEYCIFAYDTEWGTSQCTCDNGMRGPVDAPIDFEATYCDFEDRIKLDWVNVSSLSEGIFLYKDDALIDTFPPNQQSYLDTLVRSLLEYEYCLSSFYYQIDTIIDTTDFVLDTLGQIWQVVDPITLDSVLVGFDIDTTSFITDTTITSKLITSGKVCEEGKAQIITPVIDDVSYQIYEDRVDIDWTNNSLASDAFNIYRDGFFIASVTNTMLGVAGTTFTYTDYDCISGVAHDYCITGHKIGRGESEQICRGGGCLLYDPITILVSEGTFEDMIDISWVDSSFVNEAFKLYKDGIEVIEIQDISANPIGDTFSYTDVANITANELYVYCVESYHSSLGASRQTCDTGYVKMRAPTNVVATTGLAAVHEDRVVVTWTDESAVNDGYYVYKDGVQIANLGDVTTYTDLDVLSLKEYKYCVQAYDAIFGESAQVCFDGGRAKIATPSNVVATDMTFSDKVTITWANNSAINNGFKVYRDGALIATLDSDVLTYDDFNGTSQSIHNYAVVAFHNTLGQSEEASDEGSMGIGGGTCAFSSATLEISTKWSPPTSFALGNNSNFGYDVDLEAPFITSPVIGDFNHNFALIGAPGNQGGRVYIYEPLNGDSILWSDTGTAYDGSFTPLGGNTTTQGNIDALLANAPQFGSAVAVDQSNWNMAVGGPERGIRDDYTILESAYTGDPTFITNKVPLFPVLATPTQTVLANFLYNQYTNTMNNGLSSCPPLEFQNNYCASTANSVNDTRIDAVVFNGATNGNVNTPTGGAGADYTDNTGTLFTTVNAGTAYPLSVTIGTENATPTFFPHAIKVYIDFNRDGDYTDAGENVLAQTFTAPTGVTTTTPLNVTIPTGAAPGRVGMRVVVEETPTVNGVEACGNYGFGETEDYQIEIAFNTFYIAQDGTNTQTTVPTGLPTCNGTAIPLLPLDTLFTIQEPVFNVGQNLNFDEERNIRRSYAQAYTDLVDDNLYLGDAVDILETATTVYALSGGPRYMASAGLVHFSTKAVGAGTTAFLPAGGGIITPTDGALAAGDQWGNAVAFTNNSAGFAVGSPGRDGAGAVYIFNAAGTQGQKIVAPGGAGSGFGTAISIDISEQKMAIGAPGEGKVYIYVNNGGTWGSPFTIGCGDPLAGFGKDLSLDGNILLVGSPNDDHNGTLNNAGAAFIYQNTIIGWTENARLQASDAAVGDQFGFSVAADAGFALVGAPFDDDGGTNRGSVYSITLQGQQKAVASDGKFENRVELSWTYIGDNTAIDGFLIFRNNDEIANLNNNEEIFFDFNAIPGTVYQYCIIAHSEDETVLSAPFCDLGYILPNGYISGLVSSTVGSGVVDVRICADAPEIQHSLLFDGTANDFVQVPNGDELKQADVFSVAAWAKVQGGAGTNRAIITSQSDDNANGFKLFANDTDQWAFSLFDGGTAVTLTGAAVALNEWTYLVGTYDGTEMKMYVNGILQPTEPLAGYTSNEDEFLKIGSGNLQDIINTDFYFNGKLDDLSIWGNVLSQDDVSKNMERMLRGNEPGLLAYWHCNDGQGEVLGEYSQNSNINGGSGNVAHFGAVVGTYWHWDVPPITYCTFTDLNGDYELGNVFYSDLSTFTVTPYKENHGFSPGFRIRELSLYNTEHTGVNFTDTSVYSITGQVLYNAFAGVQCRADSIEIKVKDEDSTNGISFSVYTDPEGNYATSVENTGNYSITPFFGVDGTDPVTGDPISVNGHAFNPPSQVLEIVDDVDNVDFTDITARTLNGSVRGACNTLIGTATLQISSEPGCFFVNTVTAAATGNFQVANLPPLRYNVKVTNVVQPNGQIDINAINYFETRVMAVDLRKASDTLDIVYNRPFNVEIAELSLERSCFDEGAAYVMETGKPVVVPISVYQLFADGSQCPADSGTLYISDNISGIGSTTLRFYNGLAFYTITPGEPLVALPYTLGLTVAAVVDGDGALTPTKSITAVIDGTKALQGTFVTELTNNHMILRNPPGNSSYSYLSKDTSYCVTSEFTRDLLFGVDANLKFGFGGKISFVTAPLGVGTEINTSTAGGPFVTFKFTQTKTDANNQEEFCVTGAEQIQTPDNPVLTGPAGDVFMGSGVNILYAKSFKTTYNPAACSVEIDTIIEFAPNDFETTYIFTRKHIETHVLPELESFISAATTPEEVSRYQIDTMEWKSLLRSDSTLQVSAFAGEGETDINPFSNNVFISDLMSTIDKINTTNNPEITNYSFSAGTVLQQEITNTRSTGHSFVRVLQFDQSLGFFLELSFAPVDINIEASALFGQTITNAGSNNSGSGKTVGFVFDDSDFGDFFSINVATDHVYGTPVFKLISGRTSCPREISTDPAFANFVQQRDSSNIDLATGYTAFQQVPYDEPATFVVNLTNQSQSLEYREYHVRAIAANNPNGAVITINGQQIQGGVTPISYFLPPLVPTTTTVTIEKGPLENNYDDLAIQIYAPCDYALWENNGDLLNGDTLFVSVHFNSPCTTPDIAVPSPSWFINNVTNSVNFPQTTDPHLLSVAFDGYDLGDTSLTTGAGFNGMEFQYREATPGSPWIPEVISLTALQDAFNADPGVPPNYTHMWNTANLADGEYEIRVKSNCQLPAPNGSVSYSQTVTGVIDRSNVALFGTPEPSDGILNNGDDVVVNFNEILDCGLCTSVSPCFLENIITVVNLTTSDTLTFDNTPDDAGDYNVLCGGVAGNQLSFDFYDIDAYEGNLIQVTIGSLLDVSGTYIAVRDLNGNLVDPNLDGVPDDIQWSFLVQQNDVYWNPSAISMTMSEGAVETAIVSMDNISTGPQSFNLDFSNVPVWMGIDQIPNNYLAAGAEQDINLVFNLLDVMLPDSTYTHNLIAYIDDNPLFDTSGDGIADNDTSYSQTLPISVTVLAQPPVWQVNPADFAYSMNMIVELDLNGALSTDVFDQIGAFVNGELRGFANIEYLAPLAQQPSVNPYLAFITVYSNTPQGDEVTFRAWDAAPGIMYGARRFQIDGPPFMIFDSSITLGELSNPETLFAGFDNVVCNDLNPGWNLISFNVTAADMSINTILAGVNATNGDVVKTQNQDGTLSDVSMYDAQTSAWLGTIDSFNNEQAYYLKVASGGELCVTGVIVDFTTATIPVLAGWNGIPFLLQETAAINAALANLTPADGDQVLDPYQGTFATYNAVAGTWLGSLAFLEPGTGYLYNAQNANGFTFAAASLLDWEFNSPDYQYSMNVIGVIEVDGDPSFDADDMIGAFVNGEARGQTQNIYLPELGLNYIMLTVYSNDISGNETVEFRMYDADADTVYNTISSLNLTRDHVEGTIDNPYTFAVYTCGEVTISTTVESCIVGNDGTATVHTSVTCGLWDNICDSPSDFEVGLNNAVSDYDISPYSGYWQDARYQFLYTAEELQAAGLTAGTLSSIAFNVLQKKTTIPFSSFTIKLKCTNETSLTAPGAFHFGLKTVFSGNYNTQAGWNTHSFSHNYDWDGTSNMIVEICYDNTGFGDDDIVAATSTSASTAIAFFNDFTSGCAETNAFTQFNKRPDIRFGACTTTYAWSDGQTTATAIDLGAGVYSVEVTLPNSCNITAQVPVSANTDLDIVAGELLATCDGLDSGEAIAHISGGIPPYSITWSNGATTEFISGLSAGVYTATVIDAANCVQTAEVTIHSIAPSNCSAIADIRVFLQGAYVTNYSMSTSLNAYGLLPLTQPYNTAPWNYTGTESVTAMPPNAVDWVLVEARNAADNSLIVASKAAILLQNGYLQDIDGSQGVRFDNMPYGDYYLVVRHRNHLAAMSPVAVSLPNQLTYNFSTGSSQAMGANQLAQMSDGVYGLFAGDINSDGVVTITDFNMYQNEASSFNQYLSSDCNLNRAVTVADFNLYQDNASIIGISQIRY